MKIARIDSGEGDLSKSTGETKYMTGKKEARRRCAGIKLKR